MPLSAIMLSTHSKYQHFTERYLDRLNYTIDTFERWDIGSKDWEASNERILAETSWKLVAYSSTQYGRNYLLNSVNPPISIDLYVTNSKKITVNTYSFDGSISGTYVGIIKKLMPEIQPKDDDSTKVSFWNNTVDGPKSTSRFIQTPGWEAIKHNYGYRVRDALGNLMDFKPKKGGQLIIWHGEPGTGKTYALRALCSQWKDWCTSEYILDPELMFTASPSYMSNMLFGSQGDLEWDEDSDEMVQTEDSKKWKLLICEDTGQLLGETAKSEAGQGLSRLLNIADGFIGQGLRVLILITTNEDFDKMHPAVTRKGRCAAVIHFENLDAKAAQEWGEVNNIEVPAKSQPISDLYELLDENKQIINVVAPNKVGFGPLV